MSVNAAGNLPLHFKLATVEPMTAALPSNLIYSMLAVNPAKPTCLQLDMVNNWEDKALTKPLVSTVFYWDSNTGKDTVRLDMEV